ncbi:MAG: MFS transporter [Bryobacterales bacterium]|nr:MFS transporter [Bryobacterales bacterium]MBV9401537.1 MFS transporter [Bryobacterales bacterium]
MSLNKGWRVWLAPGVMMLCTLLAYIDRQTLAVLSPTILADTGLSAEAYAKALTAFSVAYMIANPLWGSVLDYVGLRLGMLVAVSIWTIASVSHAWLAGFLGFAVARTILGIGEGAAFPGGFRTAMEALPAGKQSRGMALAYSGASLGNIITPLIVTPIALWFGWRAAFLITGAIGAAWLALWWKVARPPLLMPAPPRSKLKFIFPSLFDRRAWMVMCTFGLGGFGLGVVLYMSPLFLNRALGFTQADLGRILWIPSLGYEAGYFFWGWVADRYVKGDTGRATRVFLLLTLLALPPALVPFAGRWAVLALFFWAMFIADGFIMTAMRMGGALFPPDRMAMVAGLGSGSWSAVLAALLPQYGRWVDTQNYVAIFLSMSLVPALGTVCWLILSRRKVAEPMLAVAGTAE